MTAIPTPDEWLANFNATIAEVKAKTEAFQRDLEHSGATEESPDGSLSVTVAPNGSLTNLRIDESAWRGSGAELAGKIMALARRAQRAAAVNVAEAFAPLGSPDSEALHMITGYLPEEEEVDEEPERPGYSFDEPTPQPGSPTPAPPQLGSTPGRVEPPRRPGRPSQDEDDDFGDDDLFSR
ncbi:YbaB/EbfC family nucleoid-associated protein [Actinophytocola oryzae]|uniref:YbaB/EbfC DNA-binding family protein n=1 Tax=Actinophytocola oryzae TaxID=502181 RepID=A0A4R7VNT0_9PSEU|nr:YbaB/EbfC family nucleoid-associated protein [Actinophytocola oryzae]TDV51008.1 YbaB/EbfC DNA-binding family protein [Actinophytocola oryzae]